MMRTQDPGNLTTIDLPVLEDVPVMQRGNGKLIYSVAPQVGSYGLVHISDRCLEQWMQNGGTVDPGSARRFDISDAVFEPGMYPLIADGDNGLIDPPILTDRMEMRTRSGVTRMALIDDETIEIINADTTITIDGDNVKIEHTGKIILDDGTGTITMDAGTTTTDGTETVLQSGADFAIQFTNMKTAFDTMKTDLNNFVIWATAHVHPGVLAGAASTAVAVPPPVQSGADMSGAKVTDVRLP
jgi:hypothetical protein